MDSIPARLKCGLDRLSKTLGVTILSTPEFIENEDAWVLELKLTQPKCSMFIPKESRWFLLIDRDYPIGRISLYPSLINGLTHTFPHQDRNLALKTYSKKWRTGKPCLDSPSQRLGHVAGGPEPKSDPEDRLKWHVERCLAWLEEAANTQLMVNGEPFELPQCPPELLDQNFKIVHDESSDSFSIWNNHINSFGEVWWGTLPSFDKVLVAETFFDSKGKIIRKSQRKNPEYNEKFKGYWWLWSKPVVLPPWCAPSTWGDLRKIAHKLNIDIEKFTRWLARRSTEDNEAIVLIGYRIPTLWHGPATEVHWQAIKISSIANSFKPPNGFRDNQAGINAWLRSTAFADTKKLAYLTTANWHPSRLQARGRFPDPIRARSIAIIGAGALGSAVAELLARGGSEDILIIDPEELEVGNLVRHTLTGVSLGKNKAKCVAMRLRGVAPMASISANNKSLPQGETLRAALDRFDIIIDCTSEDDVIRRLGAIRWAMPRIFLSASLGFAARKLFFFQARGHSFPSSTFFRAIESWLEHERKDWIAAGETLEGAGCWSPLFPARSDDVWLAAVAVVKILERTIDDKNKDGLTVLKQTEEDGVGFQLLAQEAL